MFTQCPECQTTFRVSAKVLQQAAGRVRCGGCGHAFNALEHLSEDDDAESQGEAPEKHKTGSHRFSDEENEELLQTLDKLAGSDVRIEDTGVEWRVFDEADADAPTGESGDTSSLRFVIEGETARQASRRQMLHRRHDDLPPPVPEGQESLDLPDTEEASPSPSEPRYDDNTVLPEDFGRDEHSRATAAPSESETPRRRASDHEAAEDRAAFEEAQVDLALGDPGEWVELLDEVNGEDQRAEQPPAESDVPAVAQSDRARASDDAAAAADMPSDIDTQFLQQAEDMGLDTGSHEIVAADETEQESEIAEPELSLVDDDAGPELSLTDDDAEPELESTDEFEAKIAVAAKALSEKDKREAERADTAAPEKKPVPPKPKAPEAEAPKDKRPDVSHFFDEDSQVVETIVLEGDRIHDALQEERRKTVLPYQEIESPASLMDTYASNRDKLRGGRRATDPPSYTVIASVFVLGFVLLGQILHQSRQALATYGAFNHTIGPIYRALGRPVAPDWDVTGWQFEATNGSVDESEALLTIYSRIANKSERSLPYPLVHVSLTDRWEEIIGSRVLEPNEYLAGNLDPRKLVPSGEKFTAAITIESPSTEATGFKLNVCYRVEPGRVRCAIEDFKY